MKITRLSGALAALAFLAPSALAQLTPYAQDFENLVISDGSALDVDGWVVFGNVFDPAGNYLYGYGTFPAPNPGNGFSAIGTGSGGMGQGLQYLNVYNDYANGDHLNGNYIEASVFQEQVVSTAEVGETWFLRFDYLKNPTVINGQFDSTMKAFIKVLKQSDGSFDELGSAELDTTNASTTAWASANLGLLIDASFDGELLQFGFQSTATAYNDTGVFYDNITVNDQPGTGIGTTYCSPAVANTTGLPAVLSVIGSDTVADNNVTLGAIQLPPNQFGIFIVAPTQGFIPNPGGSMGNLCVVGSIGRYNGPGQLQNSGATGEISLAIDLAMTPSPMGMVSIQMGETWNFQAWYRDFIVGTGATSNFTDAISVDFL